MSDTDRPAWLAGKDLDAVQAALARISEASKRAAEEAAKAGTAMERLTAVMRKYEQDPDLPR